MIPPVNPELSGETVVPAAGASGGATKVASVSDLAPEPGRSIEVILAYHPPDIEEFWKSAARMQAGVDKVKLKISALDELSPKSKQADLVREALSRDPRPRAVVIETADPADVHLAQAIESAQAQGIPVVLVGRPLAGGKPAPIVIEPKFAQSAAQLVAATMRIAKVSEQDPKGGALIVLAAVGDPYTARRAVALKDALQAAGVTNIDEVRFGSESKEGDQLLKEHLKANPKISMVFGVDPDVASVIGDVINAPTADRLLIASCYTTEDHAATIARVLRFAAVAEFTPTRVLRKAMTTASALSQGKELPPLADYRITVTESAITSSSLKVQFDSQSKSPQKTNPKGLDLGSPGAGNQKP